MLMPPREWENPFVGGYYGKKHNYKQQSAKEISNTLSKNKEKK
jgi:DNA-directed RNA polymerase